ncbi:ABC transporter ATP-binding protein [Slackia faecicanis]|uniref:ABC transporter ATP-binding protein n=1 Tax=Slackia faecicanis TaxID=255723 RepID=A0A3N0AGM6_9ACTN|nr:ATP-binding cassette domain-containing protein [Slackia faecicanis]RNL21303.1 ABC transporter ATP-binding protein [Slackia faecicanis]
MARTILTLSHIAYTHPQSADPVLHDVSATFAQGWTALVGDNGCGKTTLARIACGLEKPDDGNVSARLSFAYCEQDPRMEPALLYDFACDFSPEATRLRAALEIPDDAPWRFESLSGGEQKKLQIAVALWSEPELLVLDEPTNHVDAACRACILESLRAFSGIGIVISHDRLLIDSLPKQCLCFENGRFVMRPGDYGNASEQRKRELLCSQRANVQAKRTAAALQHEYIRRAEEASKTAKRRSARMLDKHDSDGRAKRKLAIYTGQDGKAGALASGMNARLERAWADIARTRTEKRYDGSIAFDMQPHPRKTLMHVEEAPIACGPQGLLRVPRLYVGNTDHLGISGNNGSGKTTLVRHLLDHMDPDIRILFIPQEYTPDEARRLVQRVRDESPETKGRILSIVARLDSNPDRILEGGRTSPGELRKLAIACGIADGAALIMADEPTNHLDIHSVEALEQALAAFPGALVAVSHDERFLEAVCTRRLHITRANGLSTCTLS